MADLGGHELSPSPSLLSGNSPAAVCFSRRSLMQLFSLLVSLFLFAVRVSGSIEAVQPNRIVRRVTAHTTPDDPTQTGTIATCNLWYDVVANDNCATVEAAFGITSAEFLAWNPAVSSDCETNFWVGDSYCVGIASGSSSIKSTTTSKTSSTRTAETTNPAKPTQSGQPSDCDAWYDAVSGDSCGAIETAFNITSAQFLAWNPVVSADCESGFEAGYSYCVGVNPNKTSSITSTTSSVASSTSPPGTYSILGNQTSAVLVPIPTASVYPPTATQSGILSACLRYYQATAGDTCQTIVNAYSNLITMDDFLSWNPSVGTNCTGLYVNWYYCVDAPMDQSNLPNATSQYLPGWTPIGLPEMNSTFDPYPLATAVVSGCQSYYEADEGDTCTNVTETLGYLDVAEFEDWNVGVDCTNLTAAYYCVANFTSLPLPSTVSTLPSPVQSSIISSCTSWYQATIGDDCSTIPEYFETFTEANFLTWNPALGSDCSGLVVGDYYCVAIPGTPTTATATTSISSLPTNGVGPQPEQPGIPSNCNSYWFVSETDNCTTIASANDITVTELVDWNPALGSDCDELEPNYYICVGIPNTAANQTTSSSSSSTVSSATSTPPSTTTSSGSVGIPTPVQTGMVSGCERFYYVESGNDCYDIAADANVALSDFYSWNPAIGTSCGGLQADFYVCIGLTGPTTTITSGNPVPATPSPTQTGMVSGCVRFYDVESGDSCADIALDAGISLSTFYAWNPAVGSSCGGLQAGVYVCIGISGQATTITSGTLVPAPTST